MSSSTGSTSYRIAAMVRLVNDTSRSDLMRTLRPVGEVQTVWRRSVPVRKSRVRSCSSVRPYRRSIGSSSTSSRMILPSVTLTTVCPDSG